jgi:hypothetical protein
MHHSRARRRLVAVVLALVAVLAAPGTASALAPGSVPGIAPADDAGGWEFLRAVNITRLRAGVEPLVVDPRLSALATTWVAQQATAGTLDGDPDLDSKLPRGVGSSRQALYTTSHVDPAGAGVWLADSWAESHWSWAETTDVGVAMVQRPLDQYSSEYTLYVIGAHAEHPTAASDELPLYRFFRPSTGTHFYTTTQRERDAVLHDPAFRYEGLAAFVLQPSAPHPGTRALHRFHQPASGTHFYTSTPSEYRRVLGFPQYGLDGVAAKVYSGDGYGRAPMYRFFRPASGTHFYTATAAERDRVRAMPGYTFEGVAFYLRRAA